MAFIRQIGLEESSGPLRRFLEATVKRAGRIWNIVGIQSLNAQTAQASMRMYGAIMFGESALSRRQREMLAVVTSRANNCFY